MNVSHFIKICQALTILHQLICIGVSLILEHGVYREYYTCQQHHLNLVTKISNPTEITDGILSKF